MHVFNRNSLYGEFMLKEKNQANDSHQSQSQYSVQQEDALGWIWTKFESLFPVVRFHLEMSKFCFGNHLIPRALVLTCQKAHGTYMQKHATWQFDKYQHWVSFDFYDFVGSLVPVSKYSGHYAVEEPPQKADTFRVFSLGRGQITYKQDQPGLISVESEHAQLDENQESVFYTFPEWKMAINVEKDFLLAYGPWADRQREMLWKFFFPPTYRPAEVTSPPCVGQLRTTQKFTLDISSSTTVQMDLWFVQDKNKSNKFALHGGPDSTFKVTIPWVTEEDGSTVEMALSLANGSLVTDCLWHDLLTSSWFDLQLNVHYPRHWNSLQTWTFDLNGQDIVFSILYSQKDYIKGFFEDWSSGSRPDILYFVPYIYKFKIFAQPFDLRLLVNDYNWVAPTPENAFASLCLEKFKFDFDLPFIDFLPATVPIKFDINASSASLRLSVPETSTLLYLLKEMHANLRLANSNCKLQKNNPFRIIEETLPNTDAGKILHKRYWIECWRAIGVHVKIGYTYYPIVWVPDFWRFLPQCWGKHSSKSLSPTEKTHILAPRDPEEAALGDLRPEGSKARGPTESELIRSNFDPSYMLADQLDVHVAVPSSQLLFYGALIRYIIHFKENYFGCYQTPITAEDLKVYGLNEKGDRCLVPPPPIPGPNHPGKPDTVVDPREYRPFAVRVTVAIHNLQAHLPMHTSSEIPLCPTAFLDCIGFEMDKIFNETKLQLLFSPVLLCVFDKCNAYRPPNAVNLSTGRAQLTGLELRGQALFSNRGLPLKAETVEYAWLFEITCGTLTGEITAPQLSSIVQSVSNLIFSAIDSENAILSRRSGELCQHALVPTQCSFWSSKSPGAKLCPTELELKYRLFRFNLDGVELAIVEAGTCLMIMLDAVRVARCNMHDVHSRDGISVFLPRVQFLQLIKPLKAASQTLTRDGTLHSASAKTPLPSQPWLEAGSLGFGPVHLHSGISGLDHAYRDAQLIFIRHHDAASHRLWFLWLSHDSVSSSDAAVRCGCYGNCAFFGPNASGKVLLDEVLTGVFSRRAVFFSDLNSNASGVANDDSLSHPLTPFSTGASGRSLGVNFGESLFEPDQLLFQLHNSNVCSDTSNGFALMRLDAVVADEASKFETAIPSRMYYCSPEEEDKDSSFGALPSSSDEGPQNLKSTGDFWRKMGRKRGISRDRGNHTYLSTASLEKPLVAGEVEDGAVTGDRDDSVPDNLSLASLDGMSIGLPAAQILPPPPPPRQLVSDAAVTHVSTSSIPLFTDTADTPFTQRRGSTSSLHFNHEPSKASDDSTLSGEDFTAKFVDLHGQLNRPITESTLLRTAYVRHLNRYITNTELCPPLRLKHRWRVCRRFRDRQQCTVQNENGERLVEGRPKCGCRIGIAKAPEFLCSATGFSFRSMVDAASETTISEITPTSSTHPGDTSSAPSSFRISDLRPLLYPHCCDAQVCESSTASVSRSSTTVSVLGPVDIFLTPLCTECIDRYITIMAPVLANRSPSSVIDELHFKCILSAGRQGKVLYEQQLKHQEPQGCSHAKLPPSPSLPQPTKRSMFFDQFSENTLWFHRIGGDHSSAPTETQVGSLGHRAQLDTPFHAPNLNIPDEISNISVSVRSRKQQLPLSDSRHHLAEENNLVGFLSLGRVNIGFMQIYAVEDIVTIDSLSLGLHDLTCVSLLTLAVDMVKIEVLNNRRILHYSVESHELESPTHSFSPDLFSRSLAGQRKLSEVQEEHDEDTSTAVSPLLSSPHRLETTTPRPDSQTAAPTSPSPRKHYAEDDVEAGLPLPTPVMRSCPSKVVSATEVRHTERLVCNFSISRIHSQLRRLTRESSFTPEVLLTAIPFSASRVFFAFDADQQSRAVTCKSPVAGGLYTGVHGPVPANPVPPLPLPHKPPVPSSSESFLPEHSAGWIMFESGMEELTLLFVQRKGYGDSLEEKSELRTTVKKPMPTTSVYHSQDENVDTEDDSADLNRNIGCSSTLVGDLENKTLKDDTDDENEGIKNAFLMNLHVKTVWLNFPAPKHLPNKRRVEIIRSDWNFLSTVTPTVNAWIGPCNRLASNLKHLMSLAERRTLSVLACLMMEAVKGDKPLPDFRFSSLEDEVFKTYSTLRTPDARRLRYDPSCQIFTTLRRYLQALRKQDGQASVDARLNEWLCESVLPEKMMLLRGLFLILREWRVAVDVMVLTTVTPVMTRKLTALLRRKKENTADGGKAVFSHDPVERRPSGLTLRMFELLTQNPGSSSRTLNPAGDRLQNQEVSETVEEVDDIEESDLDDESLTNDSRARYENTILYRFLQDAQHGIRQVDSSANILDGADSSPNYRGAVQRTQVNVEPEVVFRSKANESGRNGLQHRRSPSITSENVNQINHLRGQFRFVDDAQRLFRPLLEAIGVNIKGVRRSTLMKKFGGLFAAEGMLDCFQIEICDSLENPLQKLNPSSSSLTLVAASAGSYHLRASTLPKVNVSSVSAAARSATGFPGPSTQRALMCHRFSTKITLRDVVGFNKQDGANPRLGDVELRSTTTKIIADLHVDSISQHSNMPLFRLTHQFVTMFYCARDAQNSAERRRNLIACKSAFDTKDSATDTVESGSTLKSRPDYVRLSGHSQDSTIDSATHQPLANAGDASEPYFGSAPIPIPGRGSQHLPSFESSQDPSLGRNVESSTNPPLEGTRTQDKPFGLPFHLTATDQFPMPPVSAGGAIQSSSIPECWRRMLRYIDLYSTVPETKNVTKRASVMPTILEENDYFRPEVGHKEEAATHLGGVAGLMGGSASRFSFMGGRHDTTVDLEAGLGRHHSATSVSASYNSTAAGTKRGERSAVPSAWFKTSERIPTVVLVTMRVRQMTVSAVLSEVNLTAVVRKIHGSFTKTSRVRGHSLFKERSSNFSFSGHFGDSDVRLTEGIGKFAQEAAYMKVDHSHVLLSCVRSSRYGERNACTIGLGHVEITVPHHPVSLHGMVQRQARHLSTTVSEFFQLPNNPIASSSSGSRKRTCTDGWVTANPKDFSRRTGAEEHHLLGNDGASSPLLIINMTAIARGLTVNVSLHPSLNAMYTVDPVYFLGQVGPNGYLDVTINKHALSFQSLQLPIMFPQSVSLSLPKVLAFLARRQSPGGHCILGPSGERVVPHGLASRKGSYLDAQVSVGFFEQRLPSDRLNYIMVVVKLLMKEINEVIRKMAGEQQPWQTAVLTPGSQLRSRSIQRHHQQQQTPPFRRCSASMVPPEPLLEVAPALPNRFSVSNRFSFRVKFGGILLLAKTSNGAVKFETSEMHVELSNRIGRTHSSWYTDSSSSFSARPHPDLSGSTPPTKKTEKTQPAQDSNSRPQAPSDTLSFTSSESILIYAKIDHLSIELGHLDQDVFYEVWDQEFRTLAFFRTAIALRSLLAEEASLPTNQQVHRNHPLRSPDEGFSRSGHARSMPPRTDGDVVDTSGGSAGCVGGHSGTTSGASSVIFTPFDNAGSCGIVSAVGQEAFLVSLHHPIIWAKPSAFDRAILMWMVYNSEFAKWNEHIQQLDALSSEVNVTSPKAERSHNGAASAAPLTPAFFSASVPSRPVASPSPSSPSSVDNTSSTGIGSPPKRSQLRDSTPQPALPVPSGPILFFQLNVEDLGICLPTNILQLSPQSMEVYSRTALVLTLEQSRISTCLRGSLVSEGEFTDFCLRFDDDFNVGSDDWKPDKIRSIVTVKQEEHLVIMNACVVPSGTFRVCWKAVEALRAEERGRWLVKIQYQMRGLDLHMDDNIGRRLNALFDILTNMDNVEGEQQTSGCTGGGGVESGAKNGAVDEHSSSFQPNLSVDDEADVFCPPQTKALDHPILPIENTNFRIQEQFSQYRRLKWSDLRRKTTITSLPRCDLQRTGSLVKDKSLPKQISSAVPSPTLTEDDDDLVSVGGSLNACDLSVSSRTDSVYFDVEDPVSGDRQSAMAAHLTKAPSTLRVDKHSDHRADTYSLQDECLIGVTKVDGERTTSARGNFRQPPTPPPRKHASTKQPSFSSPSMEEPPRSSLLLELDINIHVDSGRCGLHPRLSKQEGGGKSIWPTSPAIGSPSLQDDLYKAYLARYKRQLSQDPLLKPTDISVFYLPALDVGLHYKSHTNYDLWNQQTYRTSVEKPKARPKLVVGDEVTPGETTLETVHDTQTAVADELGKAAEVEAKATKEASNSDFERSLDPSHRFTSGTNTTTGVYPDVGRSADLYASVVLQKLPQSLIVHPGLLDFLEQALENLPAALDLESDDGQSTQPKSSVQLNDALMTSTKTFLVDVVVHLCIQPSTIRFLCLPASQMQCLITLPSMNMIFSTERLAEEILKDADGKPAGRLSITANLADNIVLGDLVSASGLNVTAILNEFRMSVFHPYGGGIGGVLRTSKGAEGTSPGDSLTLKVRDIRLNISRTVQTNVVGQQQQQQTQARQSGDPDAPSDVRAATATMTSYVTANSGTGSISLHNIVRFSGVVDIGVAEFKCDTRRSLEILHIPKAWYRNSLARALFIGKDSKIPQSAESTEVSAPPQIDDENAEGDSDVVSEDEVAEKIPRNYAAPPGAGVDDSLAKWLQKGPRLRGKARIGAGTAAAPIKLTAAAAESASKRRSATAPREGLTESPTPQTVSNTTTLPPLVPPNYHAPEGGLSSTSRGGGAKVVSWQALPIFYVKIGNLDIQTYMGSAMGRTKLDVRNVFCDGRLYQDSSKRRRGSLGAGVHLCQFTSEQGVVGGEFTLLDLESRAHFKEDPRCDPQHSGELLIGGFQLRIEYMNTNIVFLRINQAEMYLSDEWRLREADHLCVSGMGDEKESSVTVPASRKFSSPPGDRNTETFVTSNIGAPPVYVMIAGEVNWDQLQVAIARTTTVDLMRSARKVREYFEEQLREGRNSWVGQGDYLLRPENSSVGVMVDTRSTPMDSLSLPTGSGETFEVVEPMVVSAALGFSCTEANVDKLLQRHWQYPMLEAIRACLAHIGTQAPLVRRSLLESTAPPNENSVPPVLGGSLQLAGNSLALACFAGTFRSAPDWAVFNMQHPTICFETEAQREPRHRPMKMGKSSTLNKKSVAFACEGPERLPESIDEVGGWLNVRQVLSFDLGHQLQYPPQTAYVLRVRRGREQNPVKLPVTLTIAEWLEFMFTGVDITVLSYVRGANPHRASDVVKLTEFSVDFSAHVSSTSDSLRRRVDAVKTSVATITASPAAGAVVTPRRPNPLKPPTEAEILFVLPSVSMRLTSDQRQSMAHPKVSELLLFSLDLQHEKATAAAEAAKKSRVTTASGPTPSDEEGEEVREGQESSGGDGEDEESEREIEGLSAKVHLSFQTDLHGVIQLGLLDVPWLPLLIKSYIDEQMHDTESLATPDPTYAVTPRTLELAKEGFLPGSHGATVAANAVSTASPIVKDLRGYDVIHWNLSPECRLLLASNIDVPAFDKFLENIGFHRARTTIPKWLQRGVLDHLDSAVAGLVHTSLRLADEQRKNQKRGGKSEQKPQERRLLEDEY
ncbi:Uncharacterized protein ECG_02261 [Echinococcus granulosus]|nr:Uncharacterized protein ECG_02261 [Echinococcus granulosus]